MKSMKKKKKKKKKKKINEKKKHNEVAGFGNFCAECSVLR